MTAVPALTLAAEPQGAELYASKCVACHQVDGSGNPAMKTPTIAGLDRAYVRRQLTHFKNGLRGIQDVPLAEAMRAIITSTSDQEVDALSAYIASLKPMKVAQELAPAGSRGRGLYSACSSCHGAQGEGMTALGAPRIAGQYRWYLRAQLLRFRSGLRGSHPKDELGQQMRAMAVTIANDADVDVLANYIAGLGQ